MLNGKTILITGIATPDSIATATARRCLESGARVVVTALPRDLDAARSVVDELDPATVVLPLDVTSSTDLADVTRTLSDQVGQLDGALHAVAFAPRRVLGGAFADPDPSDVEVAFRASAWSLAGVSRVVRDLAPPSGGSLVALDFDADDRAWPVYGWMGVCKAALRSSARYLARDLGGQRIRVNLVAAGPLVTRAASAIPDFDRLLDAWETTAPLQWDAHDATPVADAVCFLLSDLARGVTGEVLHVDGGFHAMAAPLRPRAEA